MRSIRLVRSVAVAAVIAAAVGSSAPSVLAYGKADQPLRQIEFSANCDNPSFALCAPRPQGFGLGGIWIWTEIDADHTADVSGAACGHTIGGGGSGGAGPVHGDATWWWSATPQGFPAAFGAPLDPNGYYNVNIPGGEVIAFPVTLGHYSAHPVHGVSIQVQVAP